MSTENKLSDDTRVFDDKFLGFGGDASTPPGFRWKFNTGTSKLELQDAAANVGAAFADQGATMDMDLSGDLNLSGDLSLGAASSILSAAATVALLDATPTTINAFGNAANINLGATDSELVFGSTASRTVDLTGGANVQGLFIGGTNAGRAYLQGSASAGLVLDDSGGTADQQLAFFNNQAGELQIKTLTDAAGTRINLMLWDMASGDLKMGGLSGAHVFLAETASANVDIAGYGQLWCKDNTPNELWFTNDVGIDIPLGTAADAFSTLSRTQGPASSWTITSGQDTWEKLDFNSVLGVVGHEDVNSNLVASKADSWLVVGANGAGIYEAKLNVSAIGDAATGKDYWYGIAVTRATPIDIASVTNANPPVVTTTNPHGFHEGAASGSLGVVIAGCTGAGAGNVNGSHFIAIVSATQFALADFAGSLPGAPGVIDNDSGDVTVEVHGETMQARRYANNSDIGHMISIGCIDVAASDTIHGVIGGITDGTDVNGVAVTLTARRSTTQV